MTTAGPTPRTEAPSPRTQSLLPTPRPQVVGSLPTSPPVRPHPSQPHVDTLQETALDRSFHAAGESDASFLNRYSLPLE